MVPCGPVPEADHELPGRVERGWAARVCALDVHPVEGADACPDESLQPVVRVDLPPLLVARCDDWPW